MEWYFRFAVVEMDSAPMYGHDKTIEVFDNLTSAVEYAKSLAKTCPNICIQELRYASWRNLERRITFDSHIRWAAWLE